MRWIGFILLGLATTLSWAQESALHADFRREGERFHEACGSFGFKSVPGCAYQLFTDHPLHIAVGSIAPQNGFGFGPAFVAHYTPNESWRLSWNVDAVVSTNASWRAGAYMKIIHTPVQDIQVSTGGSGGMTTSLSTLAVHPYTVFNVYVQSTSLNKLYFFGLGPSSLEADRSVFGLRQTIIGGNVIKPVTEWQFISGLNLALLGEINGRFVDVRGNHGQTDPSIEQAFNEASAPGLTTQPGFLQLGEGLRVKPSLWSGHIQLNYSFNFQQFFAPSTSTYSFRRWVANFDHQFPLYRSTQTERAKSTNGPDECAPTLGAEKCPPLAVSRNREGAIGLRLMITESAASAGSVVPFYFQPTMGGSDINGASTLSSFQDYRFRGPNMLLLRESFEHSLWGPFGFAFAADQGKVALTRGDVGFDHLKHSFGTGFTLRAGGFPEVFLLFAWGGGEGNHTTFNMNPSLLGGSARPALD